ncbi:MAG: hypothetical protein QM820_63635 [Minicystis sp.]
MTHEPARVTHREALPDAWRALGHLDVRVQRNFFGDVEGIDSVHLALKALASALARLFESLDDGPDGQDIEDMVEFLVARNRLAEEASDVLSDVLDGVKQSTYQGLNAEGVHNLEKARENLYEHLYDMLTALEEEGKPGG